MASRQYFLYLACKKRKAAMISIEESQLITEWQKSVRQLDDAKAREIALRNEIIQRMFADHKDEGTENVKLYRGWKLKANFKLSYNVDKDKIEAALSKIENTGPEGEFIAKRIVTFTPKLSVKEYRDLPANIKRIVDSVLTIKPGQSSLELIAPKESNPTNQEAL